MFVGSADLEVQERASCAIQLLKYLNKLQEKGNNMSHIISFDILDNILIIV